MATIVILGGTGRISRSLAAVVARHDAVDSVVLAGRDEAALKAFAGELGAKARAARADLTDSASLGVLLDGADLIINGAGPYSETLCPVLEAAIAAGVDYLDYDEEWRPLIEALDLDEAARDAGVLAMIGAGSAPGLANLLAVRAAQQLDRCDGLRLAWRVDFERMVGSASENLRRWQETGRFGTTFLSILGGLAGPVPVHRGGRRVEIPGFSELTEVTLPGGRAMEVWPFGTFEPLTLPAHLPGVRDVSAHMAFGPASIRPLFQRVIPRLAAGEIDSRAAAVEIFEALDSEPERWLVWRDGESRFDYCIDAHGTKDARGARYACFPNRIAPPPGRAALASGLTALFAALVGLDMIQGRVGTPGVHTVEDTFDADDMLAALAGFDPPPIDPERPLIDSLDWLD